MNISNSQVNRLRHFVRAGLRSLFRPEPQTAVEWADANYYLPKESAYQEGRWETLPFHPKRTRKRRKPAQNPQKRLPHRQPVRRRHRHHLRLLQKMRRPDRRQQRRVAPRRHPRRRQRQLAVRRQQLRAKVRRNLQQRALRQRQNGQRILHPPWRLRMRARRKRG
ncbi:hypothetical protein FPZ27_17530 [Escherichia coli]|nr:hypothetical protein [Escherichia coli]